MKSQLTLTIIFGLLFITIISFLVFFVNQSSIDQLNSESSPEDMNSLSEELNGFIRDCLKVTALKGIFIISEQGGYFDPDYNYEYGDYDVVPFINRGDQKIPYWLYNGNDLSPSLDQIKTKLERYVLVKTYECVLPYLSSINNVDIQIPSNNNYAEQYFTQEIPNVDITINDFDFDVTYNFPMVLIKDDTRIKIDKFEVPGIQVPLGINYKKSQQLLDQIKKSGGYYNIEQDCALFNSNGYINVFYGNNQIQVYDYRTLFDKGISTTLTQRFMYNNVNVVGSCVG